MRVHPPTVVVGVLLASLVFLTLACGEKEDGDGTGEGTSPAETSAVDGESASEDGDNDDSTEVVDVSLLRDFALPLPLFADGSAWNQDATDARVLPDSGLQILATYRVLRGDTSALDPSDTEPFDWPFMVVNYRDWTVPVFRAGGGQERVLICDYDGERWYPSPKWGVESEGGPVSVPAPAGAVRPAGPQGTDADGHLVLYQPETETAYDFIGATTVRDGECESRGAGLTGASILEAHVIDFFDVRGPGMNPDGLSSARAHGTPLLAGLLVPEDVEIGEISHALAFAVPGPRNLSEDPAEPDPSEYFYPASTTETDFYSTDPYALAAGQRIRLKETIVDDEGMLIDEDELAPISRMLVAALRTYGAYLVDNAGGFAFYAEDIHSANLRLSDVEVNSLAGPPPEAPLPDGKTGWQVLMEQIEEDLEMLPIAYGPWEDGQDPATATVEVSNFEVVEPASKP